LLRCSSFRFGASSCTSGGIDFEDAGDAIRSGKQRLVKRTFTWSRQTPQTPLDRFDAVAKRLQAMDDAIKTYASRLPASMPH
jgi:hypothetical protein